MNGRNQSVKRRVNISYRNYRRCDAMRGISGDITCSESISCAIVFTGILIAYCLLDNRHATYLSTLCPPPVSGTGKCLFLFRPQTVMKQTTLLIVFCSQFDSLDLRWHFLTSVVSTEKYNVKSILCQCTMVMIAKCPPSVKKNCQLYHMSQWT